MRWLLPSVLHMLLDGQNSYTEYLPDTNRVGLRTLMCLSWLILPTALVLVTMTRVLFVW